MTKTSKLSSIITSIVAVLLVAIVAVLLTACGPNIKQITDETKVHLANITS